jgi:hypothetical protein
MVERKRIEIESLLAYGATALIALSILSIFATLLAALFEFDTIPPIIVQLPLVGLPVGFLLIITLLIVSVVKRGKANRN